MPETEAVEYKVGNQIQYEGEPALVVRICDSTALFETRGARFIIHELYAEVLTMEGQTKFRTIQKEQYHAPAPEGVTIPGPEPLLFRERTAL